MPNQEQADQLSELIESALEVSPRERAVFVRAACADDADLLRRAEALLQHQDQVSDFLETPAFCLNSELFLNSSDHQGSDRVGRWQKGTRIGDCHIGDLLGEGGMGEVYLAEDVHLGRRVAIKVMRQGLGAGGLRRFRHEARILAALNHPNIARLYDGGAVADGTPYFIMEYVEGERLDAYCRARQLSVEDRLALFQKICAAVNYAHQNLVVHRDLKPANIRVTSEGEPKLLDFGIAKLLDVEATALSDAVPTLTLLGGMTPEYASPEQLRGEAITTASDVYSLGILLYELLCGQRPYQFKSRRPGEVARVVCETEPARISTAAMRAGKTDAVCPQGLTPRRLRHRLTGDLDNIVAMALRKEPGRRYASVAQFSDDIRRHLEGLPVTARRDTFSYRTGKFVRRNRVVVAAAALVALALVGGLATTIHQRNQARQAQAQAERLNSFLQTLLGSANPELGPGRELKVVQVLDQASQQLDQELSGEPRLLAQAHLTVGQAYHGLREQEPALRHLRAALEISRRTDGRESLSAAHAEAMLGNALVGLRRQASEAKPLLRHALAVVRRAPLAEQSDLPVILGNLGSVVVLTDPRQAAALTAEALDCIRRTHGEQSPLFARGLGALGDIHLNAGDYPGAEASYRRALAIRRQCHCQEAVIFMSLKALGYALVLQGKCDEAERTLLEAQTLARRTTGENNVAYHHTVGLLALSRFLRADYLAAEAGMRGALEFIAPLVPKEDEDRVGATVVLGMALTRLGRAAEGEPLLRESLELARENHLVGFASPTQITVALGECLIAQHKFSEAEVLLLAAHQELTGRSGEQPADALAVARQLKALYLAWQKPAEAARFRAADTGSR